MSDLPIKSTAIRRNQEDPRDSAEAILCHIFPGRSPESLAKLSRHELVQLAQESLLTQHVFPHQHISPKQSALGAASDHAPESDDEREWNEPRETQNPERAMCDDVNGLSLAVQHRSYMGISSIHAIFRTMFRVKPSLQTELKTGITTEGQPIIRSIFSSASPSDSELQAATPVVDEQASIDGYFQTIHGIVPLLDEAEFRNEWRGGQRRDRPWLALLNVVLALGSLSVDDSDDSSQIYYMRAKEYLDFELLGTGCVETLQALCLLGGLYLHYRNSPNMAYTIMGVAYRIAVGLGLHRQFAQPTAMSNARVMTWRPQIRRQIWWGLFCFDTWGSMTLGRPTLGRWDPETMSVPTATEAEMKDQFVLSLDSARAFCLIATRVQHRFAQLSPITTDEISVYDAEVQNWYRSLPREFRQLDECPPRLVTAQHIMRNRYFNLRLLLYRPVLLRYANSMVTLDSLPIQEQGAIGACRDIACEAIDLVAAARHNLDKLRFWSGVWYLYQASMVLLLSVLVDPMHPESSKWRGSIERALLTFDCAVPWSLAAGRSRQVVGSMYDACTAGSAVGVDSTLDVMGATGTPESTSIWDQLGLDMITEEGWDWDLSGWGYDLGVDPDWYGSSNNGGTSSTIL